MYVQSSLDAGGGYVTVSDNSLKHRFDVTVDGDTATLTFDETIGERGVVRTSPPSRDVWQHAASSDEVTDWLDANGIPSLKSRESQLRG